MFTAKAANPAFGSPVRTSSNFDDIAESFLIFSINIVGFFDGSSVTIFRIGKLPFFAAKEYDEFESLINDESNKSFGYIY